MPESPLHDDELALTPSENGRILDEVERKKIFMSEIYPHRDNLFNYARSLTRDNSKAQDLLQETLVKAYRFLQNYEQGSNARGWLFTILRNEFINSFRKTSRAPTTISIDDQDTFVSVDEEDDSDFSTYVDLREEILGRVLGDEVITALESLSDEFREVIVLKDIEDFKYEEIAAIVGIKVGTVRSRLHRARNALKLMLKDYAKKHGYQ